MADKTHLSILDQGVKAWNKWRRENPKVQPNLNHATLSHANLTGIDLSNAELRGASLNHTCLTRANLYHADLVGASLRSADLSYADLTWAHLTGTSLLGANMTRARLEYVEIAHSRLKGANLTGAKLGWAKLGNLDLSEVVGLDTVNHKGPSTVGIDTLYRSNGSIPEQFLLGAGVPDTLIAYLPLLTEQNHAVQFYSCFISFSHKDEEFAKRLHSRLRESHIRVWFAPEDVKGGEKLHEQIEYAIEIHDRLLLVLSEHSLRSEWVITEIRNARRIEREENRRKLFPIRLVDFDSIRRWKCFDADTGKDMAVEVREYFIPDFSNWTNYDFFQEAFERLLRDLKAAEISEDCA